MPLNLPWPKTRTGWSSTFPGSISLGRPGSAFSWQPTARWLILAGSAVVADGPTTHRPLTLLGLNEMISLHRTLDDALSKLADA